MNTLEVALEAQDELGEGPWWSVADQALWRVDILGRKLMKWEPASGAVAGWSFAEPIGFAVPDEAGRVVAGLGQQLALVDLTTGQRETLAALEATSSGIRFNDGKADPKGRVWAGTMPDDDSPSGGFYRLESGGGLVQILDGITVSNGLGWSPDGTTMYYTDSAPRTIWAFDFDMETGVATNKRVFATDTDCFPDGLTVDAEGGVWSAKWGGSRVVRYEADGSVSESIAAPVLQPTSCMFGGADLDILYVTSARVGIEPAEAAATAAGSVLAVSPGVSGVPEQPVNLG